MSNATSNRTLKPYGQAGRPVTLPVAAAKHIYAGIMVAQLASGLAICPGSTAASGRAVGVSTHEQDNTNGSDGTLRLQVVTDKVFVFPNSSGDPCAETTPFGAPVFMENDHTIAKTSSSGTLQPAGYFEGMEPDGSVRVFIGIEKLPIDLFVDATTSKKVIHMPLASAALVAGTPLAAFADAEAATPGITVENSKAFGVRWNDHATPTAIWSAIVLPQDLDTSKPMLVKVAAAKSGATLADATTFTVSMFANVPGALEDAGADLGGATSAMQGDAAAKTVQEVSLSIAVPPTPPAVVSFSIKPTNGTLGTDDVTILGCWIEYQRKLFTA